jgi:CRISPR/Cas system-associated endonuclease Cas1
MSWRVVVVSRRCKLECKLGYLVCRGEETKKIFIEEISTLIS